MSWTAQTQPRIADLLVLFLLFAFDEPAPQQQHPNDADQRENPE